MRAVLWFVALLGVCVCGVQSVQAQEILTLFSKPLPKVETVPENEFLSKTQQVIEYPVGAKELSYELRIPNDWKKADDVSVGSFVVSDRIISNLAKYVGPVTMDGVQHKVMVQAIGVEYQMTAKHWLIQYVLDNKYNVQGVKAYDDKHAEAVLVFVEGSLSYVMRMSVIINGKSALLVSYVLPIEDWNEISPMQKAVIDSFKLKFIDDHPVENMITQRYLDIAEYQYPDSWDVDYKPIRSVERISSDLLNLSTRVFGDKESKSVEGRIGIHLVSVHGLGKNGIDGEIERFQDDLLKAGLFIQDELPDHDDFMFDGDEEVLSETHVYDAIDKHGDVRGYEFWITIQAHGDDFYITTLLTPQRDDAFVTWSRNTQAYKAVTKTFKPVEEVHQSIE